MISAHKPRRMRISVARALPMAAVSAAIGLGCGAVRAADDGGKPFAIQNGDRVVFYGDSITDQRMYTILTEDYIVTRFPKREVSFTHSGWGGDRVTGGGGGPIDLRIDRDIDPYHPTVVTIMLAMNDGGYHAFDDATFQTYSNGYKHLADKIRADNPGVRLTFIQPSPYDDVTRAPNFPGGYNEVLKRYGTYLVGLAPAEGATIADLNSPVVAMLERAKATDAETAAKILPDRVHPGWGGHLIMAEALLRSWNAPALVSSVSIDGSSGKSTASNARVEKVKVGTSVEWTETEDALPFPIQNPDFYNPKGYDLALKSSDFVEALDQEPLTVTNLPAANYTLKIDGAEVGTFTREQLAAGVNLATLKTPMLEQAEMVASLTVRHADLHNARWRDYQVPHGGDAALGRALPAVMKDLDSAEQEVLKARQALAQPVAHHFELAAKQ